MFPNYFKVSKKLLQKIKIVRYVKKMFFLKPVKGLCLNLTKLHKIEAVMCVVFFFSGWK